jgi:hypothetical protein
MEFSTELGGLRQLFVNKPAELRESAQTLR